MNYVKTKWIDDKTPVNAVNLNKIEDALYKLASYSLGVNSLVAGNNVSLDVADTGYVSINMNPICLNGVELKGDLSSDDLYLVGSEKGKGLSTNDFTDEYKQKLNDLDATYYTKAEVDELIASIVNKLK